MKTSKIIFISLLILSLISFKNIDNQDIVLEFEGILKNHYESYKTNSREHISKLGGGWAKQRYELKGDYKYDIQQTTSLISPYTGYFEFTLIRNITAFHNTLEEAQQDNVYLKTDNKVHKHYFAYQKGKWNVTKRDYFGYGGPYDCNEMGIESSSEAEKQLINDYYRCWENLK